MRKQKFNLPLGETKARPAFCGKTLEALSEEGAIAAAGSVEEFVRQTLADIPFAEIPSKRRMGAWEIALLALGSPIWLSLGLAAAAVVLAIFVSLWAAATALWAVFGSLAVCAVVSVPACVVFAARGNTPSGLAFLSAGMVCAGLAILLFYGCRAATRSLRTLTREATAWLKRRFIRREDAQ